jgi:hypothetical protein
LGDLTLTANETKLTGIYFAGRTQALEMRSQPSGAEKNGPTNCTSF